MTRFFLSIAAILAGLSVASGAFASHALKERLSERALAIFETGSKYQMYHALALLAIGVLLSRSEVASTLLNTAGFAFIAGVVLFSGSLYALSLSGIKWLGAVAPLGGVAFLVGWGCLAVAAWSFK
ncbi:MAG: DUF423 domain-containing protein [Xenococcaceae cyanobacterium MO_188.B29]|nr:DUF423 domain-containing protein [Xenococcaceae cyanobacterium MO_188.B29]